VWGLGPQGSFFELGQFASMPVHLVLSSDSYKWNVNFHRVAHDWEMDLFNSFFNLVYSRLRRSSEDKLCWISFKRWLFDVRSCYNVLVLHDNTPTSGGVFGEIKLL
jgi:hypothetical protein